MVLKLSQKEIGRRIMELRKNRGLSQEDVARHLHIPRASLAQMELGNRKTTIPELVQLSVLLRFSIDNLLAANFDIAEDISIEEQIKVKKADIRISIPRLKAEKLRNILLYILERCAGKPNVGETVLYKLLYFADFNYYELYEEQLTGAEYRKLPYGPVPQKLEGIIKAMIEKDQLKQVKADYHGFPQTRYIPLVKPDLEKLKASEKEVIDKVIAQYSDWNARSLSDYSHNDIPWRATDEGDAIDYELVFYREPPYSVRNYNEENEGDEF